MKYLAIIFCLTFFACSFSDSQSEESLLGGWTHSHLGTDSYLVLEKDHYFKRYSKNEIPGGGKYFTVVDGHWTLENGELLFDLNEPRLYVDKRDPGFKRLYERDGPECHSEIFDQMKIGYGYSGRKNDRLYFEEGQWTTVWVSLNPRELQLLEDFVVKEEN